MSLPSNVLQFPTERDTATLVDQAAGLKESINDLTERLRQINQALAEKADYKAGSKTGHISGRHYVAKVQIKENVKWNQDALALAREAMGDEEFFKVFKWTFEPKSAKTLAGALEFGQYGAIIESARSISEGSPYVTFEKMESC